MMWNFASMWLICITFVTTLALGSWPRQKLGSARECEGMNLHIPKWTSTPKRAPTLGVEVPVDFWIFREQLQRSKPIRLKRFSYYWKALGMYISKMGSHDPFEHLTHKL